jgi:inosine/xanthosine triphosphate pyrophosphatase family protein
MKEVLFATTNDRKINEANQALASFDIVTEPVQIEIDEIQHQDPTSITKAKAAAAFGMLSRPVVVSDISWSIPALGGFPGGYMKDMGLWLAEKDWLNLVAPHSDRKILCQDQIAYCDGTYAVHFSVECSGVILAEPQGSSIDPHESFGRIVSLDGVRSLSEQATAKNFAARPMDHWVKFGQWLTATQTEIP